MWDDYFKESALVIVDAQQGFTKGCPNELPVPGAIEIVPVLNRLLYMPWKIIYATQDWHPADHCSFKEQGGPYPEHCVQNSNGADFLLGLATERFHAIFRKGFHKDQDAYSANLDHPGFCASIKDQVKMVYLAGICTNICVFETAWDFRQNGLKDVVVIKDACACLDLSEDSPYHPATVQKKATAVGIRYIKAEDVLPIL